MAGARGEGRRVSADGFGQSPEECPAGSPGCAGSAHGGVLMNGPDLQRSLRLFERMLLIRRMEERLGDLGKAGELPGNVHLYIGQEAVATGVCAHLDDSDWVASTHRGHGHFLAKGGDPRAMAAEPMGNENGICHGQGGRSEERRDGKGGGSECRTGWAEDKYTKQK